MKLCWEKKWKIFDYGWDDSFKTKIIWNKVSFAISFRGYWVGYNFRQKGGKCGSLSSHF